MSDRPNFVAFQRNIRSEIRGTTLAEVAFVNVFTGITHKFGIDVPDRDGKGVLSAGYSVGLHDVWSVYPCKCKADCAEFVAAFDTIANESNMNRESLIGVRSQMIQLLDRFKQ